MNALNDMLVKAHQDQLHRDAEQQRMVNETEVTAHGSNVLLASLGRQMVKLGEQLVQGNERQSHPKRKLQPER